MVESMEGSLLLSAAMVGRRETRAMFCCEQLGGVLGGPRPLDVSACRVC